MEAVRGNNTHQTLLVLAHSAPEDINHLHIPENQGPLHLACHRGLVVLTQLLIWVRLGVWSWGAGVFYAFYNPSCCMIVYYHGQKIVLPDDSGNLKDSVKSQVLYVIGLQGIDIHSPLLYLTCARVVRFPTVSITPFTLPPFTLQY